MSREGGRHDNAVMESSFGTLERELAHREGYPTREEARRSPFDYIEAFDDRVRLHWTLGYVSPVQCEERRKLSQVSAH
jgi:putative transposase